MSKYMFIIRNKLQCKELKYFKIKYLSLLAECEIQICTTIS